MEENVEEVLEGCKRLVREFLNHPDHRPCETGARAQLARAVYAGLANECIDCVMELDHQCMGADFWALKAEATQLTITIVDKFEKNDAFSDVWPT